jgi:hypothetical protein
VKVPSRQLPRGRVTNLGALKKCKVLSGRIKWRANMQAVTSSELDNLQGDIITS